MRGEFDTGDQLWASERDHQPALPFRITIDSEGDGDHWFVHDDDSRSYCLSVLRLFREEREARDDVEMCLQRRLRGPACSAAEQDEARRLLAECDGWLV